MDQMIEQIKLFTKDTRALSDDELAAVASYLVGQTTFERITAFLPKAKRSYYYYGHFYEYNAQIAEACKEEPKLLPRLGRYLTAMEFISRDSLGRLIDRLLENGLTVKQVFLDSGLGAQRLLAWLFAGDSGKQADIPATLELLETERPGEIDAYIAADEGETVRAAAYLCGRRGIDILTEGKKPGLLDKLLGKGEKELGFKLTGLVLLSAVITANQWVRPKEFRRTLENHLPAALPALDSKTVEENLKKLNKDYKRATPNRLLTAIALTGFRLPMVNALARALCEADSHKFLESLYWALYRDMGDSTNLTNGNGYYSNVNQEEMKESVLGQMAKLRAATDKMGIDPAALCVWAAGYMPYAPEVWREAFQELFGGAKELLTRARALCGPGGQVFPLESAVLARALRDLTGALPEDAPEACAKALAKTAAGISAEEDNEKVAAFLLSGEGDPALLPDLTAFYEVGARYYRFSPPHFDPDYACWALAGVHPVAGRYLRFVTAKGHAKRVEGAASFLMDYFGKTPEEAADFLASNEAMGTHAEPSDTLLCLALCPAVNEDNSNNPALKACFRALVKAGPEAAAQAMGDKKADAASRLCLLDTLYTVRPDYDSAFLIGCLQDKSKKVRQYAVSFLLPRKDLAEEIRPLLEAKKKDLREAAEQLMAAYEGGDSLGADTDIVGLCTRSMPKSGTASIRWAFPGDIPVIRWKESGEKADDIVAQCYLILFLAAKSVDLPPAAPRIRAALNEDDLNACARQVYDQWVADGASTKQKGAVLMYGVHASDADVLILQRQIEDWANHSRGAIASEAVRAMAMGGSDLALMTVDSISRKFKNKQVRRAAGEAFEAAARALGTTPDALGDRIIPTLGFNERGEKVIDYGPRTFTAILSPALTMELRDGAGKTIKSLPKPGAKDDTEKAEKAKADFTALKKSLKVVVTTQGQRLEQALATGRRWSTEAWQKLFVLNPIMHSFAIGLVWGVYEGDGLKDTFRYLEDGGFTTVDEDDFDFESVGEKEIGLIHPLDLSADDLAAWKQQMEDYDIVQPIAQLDREVYLLTDEEKKAQSIDRFGGKKLLGITLMNKLQKSGWYRGSVQDAGVFYTFYREIGGVGMQLYFSGMYVSPDVDEVITVGQAGFYRAGAVERGSYVYDDVNKDEIIPLAEVSPRMFSEVVLDLTLATATSSETDENWKKERGLLFFDGK